MVSGSGIVNSLTSSASGEITKTARNARILPFARFDIMKQKNGLKQNLTNSKNTAHSVYFNKMIATIFEDSPAAFLSFQNIILDLKAPQAQKHLALNALKISRRCNSNELYTLSHVLHFFCRVEEKLTLPEARISQHKTH